MKTMKKAISVLLLVCMVSALCSAGAYAEDAKPMEFTNVPDTIEVGTTVSDIKVSGQNKNKAYTWVNLTSSDSNVIQVDNNNKITAKAVGTATLTSKCWLSGDGVTDYDNATEKYIAQKTITVVDTKFASVEIKADNASNPKVLTVYAYNAADQDVSDKISSVTWTDTGNTITGTGSGRTYTLNDYTATSAARSITLTAAVTHTSINETKASNATTITIPAYAYTTATHVNSITISTATEGIQQIVAADGSVQLKASVLPDTASDKSYIWKITSSDSSSYIDASNVLHPGSASVGSTITVQAAAQDGSNVVSSILTFSVVAASTAATDITITPSSVPTLYVDTGKDTAALTATPYPAGSAFESGSLQWKSSNENVAKVNTNGVVTAVGVGSAKITVTANDILNKTPLTKEVDITVASIPVNEIELSETSSTMTVNDTKTITATVLPTTATTKTLEWSSSDNTIASVAVDTTDNSKAVITANKVGTTTITAKATDGSGKMATYTVEVTKPAEYQVKITPNSLTLGQGTVNYFTAKIYQRDNSGNYTIDVSGADKALTWTVSGDASDGIGITDNGYSATNNCYTATVSGRFNRNYNVYASWTDSSTKIPYKGSASVTVSFTPAIVSGQNAVYNGRDAMSFVVNDSAQLFNNRVYVDGRELSNIYYSTSNYNGYLVVTLNQSFLNFLCQYYNNNGYHTIAIDTKYGAATGYFRTWGTASSFNGVKTGDDATPALWAALLAVSAVGAGAAVIICKRRKTDNG